MHLGTTLTQFIIEEQRHIPGATGEFTGLLNDVATACKMISNGVNHGGLLGVLGAAGTENVQGEDQKKMDVISNEIFLKRNEWAGHLAAMASEEMDEIYQIPEGNPRGKYLLLFDPLDGSSNIDVNVSVGSIFSILRCPGNENVSGPTPVEAFMQPGVKQVCAGYALYGPSTMLVITTGRGVNGFTLDPNVGEFVLTHENMTIPEDTREFAINMSNYRFWEQPVRRYVDECLAGQTGPRGKDFNMRWVASMVAEVHRILTRGGVFMCRPAAPPPPAASASSNCSPPASTSAYPWCSAPGTKWTSSPATITRRPPEAAFRPSKKTGPTPGFLLPPAGERFACACPLRIGHSRLRRKSA